MNDAALAICNSFPRIEQRSARRRSIGLLDHAEIGALGADVFEFDQQVVRQRVLHREDPVLRVRQPVIRIDGEGVGDGLGRDDGEAVLQRQRIERCWW